MVGGQRLRPTPRSTSPPRASASRARRSSRSSWPRRCARASRPGSTWASRKKIFTVPNSGGKEKFVVNNYEGAYSGVTTLARATDVLRQLGVRRGRLQGRLQADRRHGQGLGHPHPGVDQPRDHARRPQAGRQRARHGPRLRDAGARRRARRGHAWARATAARSASARSRCRRARATRASRRSRRTRRTSCGWSRRSWPRSRRRSSRRRRRTAPASSAQIPATFVAGKTGTTEDYGDAWFVGLHRAMTVAVWVGYPDVVKPMKTEFRGGPVAGGTFPALIWRDFMAVRDRPRRDSARRARGQAGAEGQPDRHRHDRHGAADHLDDHDHAGRADDDAQGRAQDQDPGAQAGDPAQQPPATEPPPRGHRRHRRDRRRRDAALANRGRARGRRAGLVRPGARDAAAARPRRSAMAARRPG